MRRADDEAPATFRVAFRRYWAHALALGLLTGLLGWWAIGDYVGGIVVGVGLFLAAILTGWSIDPFLPPDRRARGRRATAARDVTRIGCPSARDGARPRGRTWRRHNPEPRRARAMRESPDAPTDDSWARARSMRRALGPRTKGVPDVEQHTRKR